MYRATYVSSAVELFSNEMLDSLLKKSRDNNAKREITGMLLYKDGNFMQLLEGPKDSVLELLDIIHGDPRHRGMILLMQQEGVKREFKDWAMGFKRIGAEPIQIEGHSDFLKMPLDSPEFKNNPSQSLKLLLSFRKTVGAL